MNLKKVDVLQPLFERLKAADENDYKDALILGLPAGYGNRSTPVAVTIIRYENEDSITLALAALPYGLSVIGLCEFNEADANSELLSAIDSDVDAILFKVVDGRVSAHNALDLANVLHMNVLPVADFWKDVTCTFKLNGKVLITSVLEKPELAKCFDDADKRIQNQASYVLSNSPSALLLPPDGVLRSDVDGKKKIVTVADLLQVTAKDHSKNSRSLTYFCSGMSLVEVSMFYDYSRPAEEDTAPVIISDASPRTKYFEHYLDVDVLVVVPKSIPTNELYELFNAAVANQLEKLFHSNIEEQLTLSIFAEKPEIYHFWIPFAHHFVSAAYSKNTSEEKLKDGRIRLHRLFFARETRPYFRRSAALFQPNVSLISPHLGLPGKYAVTQVIHGHLEYKHYMQDDFNDDGWGCAYRSLQSIISWFRMQGFTSAKIPTHREIQECLVSLGDKPQTFIGTRQWIGSTEVGFVMEALLGVTCRIISVSSGAEIASRAAELESHFKIHGTPVMIGGGVLAHTIVGISRDPDVEENVQYLILDPHYTGKDDWAAVQPGKLGWVSWKDNKFWSKTSFYNMCLPLAPSSI